MKNRLHKTVTIVSLGLVAACSSGDDLPSSLQTTTTFSTTFYTHSLVIKNNKVYGWGNNALSQVGDGTTSNRATPVEVLVGGSSFSGVTKTAIGGSHSIAYKNTEAAVWTWGSNALGQTGFDPASASTKPSPSQVNVGAVVQDVAAGGNHSLAVAGNKVYAWGDNSSGQLGDTTTVNHFAPTALNSIVGTATAVAAGGSHSLAIVDNGAGVVSVYSWGNNANGQLGVGTTVTSSTPVQVRKSDGTPLTGVTMIAAGGSHSLAVTSDNKLWAWGYNGFGQLGDGTVIDRSRAFEVPLTGFTGTVAEVAAGSAHTVVRLSDNTVWAWGYNFVGQLGNGSTVNGLSPVKVPIGTVQKIESVGGNHIVVRKVDGTYWSWGYNGQGQVGDGSTVNRLTPVQVSGI